MLSALLGLIVLCASGCADMLADDSTQQDIAQLRQDVNQLQANAQRGRGETEALNQIERRTRDQAVDTSRQMAVLSSRIETLNAEINRLSSRLEQLSQRVEAVRQGTAAPPPRIVDAPPSAPLLLPGIPPPPAAAPAVPPTSALPSVRSGPPPSTAVRPTPPAPPSVPGPPPIGGPALSPSSPSATAPTSPPSMTAPTAPAPSSVTASTPPSSVGSTRATGGPSAEETYQAAYTDFSKGHYTLAIPALREFVRRFPDSPLADSAQYSIGESYFSMASASAAAGQADKSKREMEQAVQEFRKVIVNYPRGSKVPTALYKEGLALTELKQTMLAQARFQYLLEHFPQSEEAPLAKERLAALKP